MDTGTLRYASSRSQCAKPGTVIGPSDRWQFVYDSDEPPLISSRRKLVYRGTFVVGSHAKPKAARALAFEPDAMASFGTECANVGLLSALGVGPKLLAIAQHAFEGSKTVRPTIIEEDAGESLALLLASLGARSRGDRILHAPGTEDRDLENAKILYDVFVQLANAHRAGVYHRDLRGENVCVRRFGDAPADIRATLIDLELGDAIGGGRPDARATLFDTLFVEIPSRLAGRAVSLAPNPLELDMGYLAALQYHVERGKLILNGEVHSAEVIDDFIRYLGEHVPYFGYRTDLPPHARPLDDHLDIEPVARSLGLVPVSEEGFASHQLLAHARTFHRPFLDAEDMRACMGGPEARLAEQVDRLVAAKFETYKALRRAQGLEVEYERYEDQPPSLQRSNYAQAEHIPAKVRALGYLLVPECDAGTYEEVTSLTDEQVEALAVIEHDRWMDERLSAGWTLAKERDPIAMTSPYLVPYEELPERVKEYDRDPARQLIGLVRSAGLMVVRPK